MRNLKRTLSLALAAVMLMGMMVIGAGAASYDDFTDKDEIKNVEAVMVMNALGILEGGDKGAFVPNGILTREQAAKIVCYMLLGPETAEKLSTNSTVFSDVAADRWSASYIGYCVNMGILAGDGNGNFFPEAELTGAAFAKMVLVALGKDAEKEGYVGSEWTINVAVDATEMGLVPNGLVLTNPMTREQAAQMSFDGLFYGEKEKTEVTKYVVLGVTTPPDNVGILYDSYSAANTAASTGTNAGKVLGVNYTISTVTVTEEVTKDSLADKVFDLSKVTAGSTDDFGRPSTSYMQDGEEIAKYATEPVATFTAKTSAADVAKALSGYKLSTGEKINNSNTVSSASTGSIVITNGDSSKTAISVSSETVAKAIADETANGKVMEFYANDDKEITDIVVVTYTVDTVDSISTSKTGTTYTLAGGKSGIVYAEDQDRDNTIVLNGEIVEDAVVTYVEAKNNTSSTSDDILYVYPTTSFVGAQSAKTTDTITVNGTKYDLGTGVSGIGTFNNSAEDANYYVDFNGFVVKTDAIASQTNYAIVDKLALVNATGTGTNQSVEAVLVFADGSTETVNVSKINGIKAKEINPGNAAVSTNGSKVVTGLSVSTTVDNNAALTDVAVSYVEKDGAYELTYLNLKASLSTEGTKANIFDQYAVSTSSGTQDPTAPVTVTVVEKGVPTIIGYGKTDASNATSPVANNATVYLIQTGSGDDAKFSTYTGFKNVPTVKITGEKKTGSTGANAIAAVSYATNSDGEVTFVYIDATDARATAGNTATGDILYVSSTDVTETLVDGETVYEITGIVNGENNITVKTESNTMFSGLTKGQVYELTTDNDGYVTAKTLQDADDYSKALIKKTLSSTADEAKSGVIMGFTYGHDTKVIVIDDGEVVGGTINSAKNGDTIYIKTVGKTDAAEKLAIEVIYIVKA